MIGRRASPAALGTKTHGGDTVRARRSWSSLITLCIDTLDAPLTHDHAADAEVPDPAPLPSTADLSALRDLLLGPERKKLEQLWQRVSSPNSRAEDLAEVLPQALARHSAADPALLQALAPHLHELLRQAVAQDPKPFAAAFAPALSRALLSPRVILSLVGTLLFALVGLGLIALHFNDRAAANTPSFSVNLPAPPTFAGTTPLTLKAAPAVGDNTPKLLAAYTQLYARTQALLQDRTAAAQNLTAAIARIDQLQHDLATREAQDNALINNITALQNKLASAEARATQFEGLTQQLAARQGPPAAVAPTILPALACSRDAVLDFMHLNFPTASTTASASAGITTFQALLPDRACTLQLRMNPEHVFDAALTVYLGADAPAATRADNIALLTGYLKTLLPMLKNPEQLLTPALPQSAAAPNHPIALPTEATVTLITDPAGNATLSIAPPATH